MKLRTSIVLAGMLALTTGCAAGSGGTAAPEEPAPRFAGEVLPQGEQPRQNTQTRTAARALEDAAAADAAAAESLYQQALEAAQAGIAADPQNPLSYRQAAQAYVGLEDYVNAAMMYDRAEELRPIYRLETERAREELWIELYGQAAPLVNSGQYEEAIAVFEQADAIYDNRPEVKITLGQLLVQQGQYERGVELLQEAQGIIDSDLIEQVDSATADSWREQGSAIPVTIAQAQVNAGQFEDAVVSLRALLAAEPDDPSYLNTLASVFLRMEMPDSADAVYDRLMTMDNLDATQFYNIGVGRYQASDFVSAADAFARAAEVSPNERDALELWARSLQIAYAPNAETEPPAGTLEELLEAAQRWHALDPYSRNAHLIAAQTANRMGNDDLARELVMAVEDLPFFVDNLQIQRDPSGGGIVVGTVTNVSLEQGTQIELDFEFFDETGAVIGTQSVTVEAPMPAGEGEDQGATTQFRVDFAADQKVHGYGYTVGM